VDIDLKVEKEQDFSVVLVSGRIDATTSEELEDTLLSLLDNGEKKIILDLEQTEYISSAGLRVLVVITKQLYDSGYFCLCNASENVLEIIEMAGFHVFMNICDDRKSAITQITEE